MNWQPQDKPGYTLLHAQQNTNLYVIQKKGTGGVWRLFISRQDGPLKTIFVGVSLQECTDYAEGHAARNE